MIYNFANKIAIEFLKKQSIKTEEKEIVTYGLFSIISKILYAFISFVVGALLDCFFESVCFYICFLFIKKYAGGFHAETEFKCFLVSSLSIIFSILEIFISKQSKLFLLVFLSLSMIFYLIIALFAPVPSIEKPLDKKELIRYSKISKIRVVILIAITFVSFIFKNTDICVAISAAIVLEGLLLIAGKIKYERCIY